MKTTITAYVATLAIFVAIDFVWLSTMAERLYRPAMGDMLAPEFRVAPAVAFYLLYAGGLTFLAVREGLRRASPATALIYGAVVGFTAYATYDLTNQATLKDWSIGLTLADLAWGSALSAVSAAASVWFTQRVRQRTEG